jgi:hypothetical protein
MSPASSKKTSCAFDSFVYTRICCKADLQLPVSEVAFSLKGSSPSLRLSRSTASSSDRPLSFISVTPSLQICHGLPILRAPTGFHSGAWSSNRRSSIRLTCPCVVFHIGLVHILISFVFQPLLWLLHSGIYVGVFCSLISFKRPFMLLIISCVYLYLLSTPLLHTLLQIL